MKVCPHCGETYQEFIDFCFVDGEVLALASQAAAVDSVAPGVEGVPVSRRTAAAVDPAATPVPRSSRRSMLNRGGTPSYGAPTTEAPDPAGTPVPAPNAADDDDPEPPPQSLIETAPILRPQRPTSAASAAPTPLSAPTAEERAGQGAVPTPAPLQEAQRPPPPAPVKQLINTTPKAVTFAGEVVEPESSTMLFAGIGALGVGVLLLFLGVGAVFWVTGMVGSGDELADAGHVVDPAPPPPRPEPLRPVPPDPAPEPVQPATLAPVPAPAPVAPDPDPAPAPDPAPDPRPDPAPVAPGPRPGRPPRPAPDPAPAAPQVTEQRVKFVSSPPGASVEVAGQTLSTPFEVLLGPGSHRWWAQQKNHKPKEDAVVITDLSDQVRTVDVTLDPEMQKCFLTSDSNVAEIRFLSYVVPSQTTEELPVGVHTVEARLQDGSKARGTIEVPPPSPRTCLLTVSISSVTPP